MNALGRHADTIAGVLIALFGAWFLWEAMALREGPGYAAVGPRVFPLIVGTGLLLSGLAVLVGSLRGRRGRGEAARTTDAARATDAGRSTDAAVTRESAAVPVDRSADPGDEHPGSSEGLPTDWRTLGLMAVALAGLILLWRPLGFILTTTLFLMAGAWVLGSRSPVRDLLAGVLVGVGTYALFTRLLGLELPAGPLEAPLRALAGLLLLPDVPARAG